MTKSHLAQLLLAAAALPFLAQAADTPRATAPAETQAQRDARMKWWRDARFGMFIHWGLYAVPAGEYNGKQIKGNGEWIMSTAGIPRAEYEKFLPQFNPVKFDAAAWVKTAKDAGMKYIVITSKHHDGFSMYDSKVSPYTIVKSTPYAKDPMRGLADECKKQGLKFCFYYSIMDWHHPSQYTAAKGKDPTAGDRQTKFRDGGKEEYVKYMKEQLRELIKNYDPAVIWFDGEWMDWWTNDDGKDLYRFVLDQKPDIIINNRVGKSRKGMQGFSKEGEETVGDFGTPEQQIPPGGLPGVDWESCMTMNNTWGFVSHDNKWKTTETLLHNLIDIVSKGGNYLLNVGPTAEGEIPKQSVEHLLAMGKWLKINGEAIYGASASPFPEALKFGRATAKPGHIYLHVFDWPTDGSLEVPPCGKSVKAARLLADPQSKLTVASSDKGTKVALPSKAPDPIASVVVLDVE